MLWEKKCASPERVGRTFAHPPRQRLYVAEPLSREQGDRAARQGAHLGGAPAAYGVLCMPQASARPLMDCCWAAPTVLTFPALRCCRFPLSPGLKTMLEAALLADEYCRCRV